jgi:hypothetical protein
VRDVNILGEEKIKKTIEAIPSASFTVLEFMKTFAEEFPAEWKRLVKRYGLYGSKRRYTVATYLANRLYTYSHKSSSILRPFRRFEKGGKGDYRKSSKEEREKFGSPWIAVYRKRT